MSPSPHSQVRGEEPHYRLYEPVRARVVGVFIGLRLLDYPNTMTFAIAGSAVGALDRFQRGSNDPPYVRVPRLRF